MESYNRFGRPIRPGPSTQGQKPQTGSKPWRTLGIVVAVILILLLAMWVVSRPSVQKMRPSRSPSAFPSVTIPSAIPSVVPSAIPSLTPTVTASLTPNAIPSVVPSTIPIVIPSVIPSLTPSVIPSLTPSVIPSAIPSLTPSVIPSAIPSSIPSTVPSAIPIDLNTVYEYDVSTTIAWMPNWSMYDTDFTVALWFKPSDVSVWRVLAASPGIIPADSWFIGHFQQNLYLGYGDGGCFPKTNDLQRNTWCHLMFTCNLSANRRCIYMNGNLLAQSLVGPVRNTKRDTVPDLLLFAGLPILTGENRKLLGSVQNLCIWNRELSAADAGMFFRFGRAYDYLNPALVGSMAGYYKFPPNNVTRDSSPNGRHLRFLGSPMLGARPIENGAPQTCIFSEWKEGSSCAAENGLCGRGLTNTTRSVVSGPSSCGPISQGIPCSIPCKGLVSTREFQGKATVPFGLEMTLTMWINPKVTNQPVLSMINDSSLLTLSVENGQYALRTGARTTPFSPPLTTQGNRMAGTSVLNRWVFLAIVLKGFTYNIYVDGTPGQSLTNGYNMTSGDGNLVIGQVGTGSYFQGKIRDLAYYNKALTPDHINQLYKESFDNPLAHLRLLDVVQFLQALYPFHGNTSEENARDVSGKRRNIQWTIEPSFERVDLLENTGNAVIPL